MSHLDSPKQYINVLGKHEETRVVKNAEGVERTVTDEIIDISFQLDVTAYVSKGNYNNILDNFRMEPNLLCS